MKIQQLTTVLKTLGYLYQDAGATTQKQGIAEFVKLFDGHENKTVSAFANLIEKRQKTASTSK